ncbi:hypothetical protein AAEX37_01592 [Oligella sp. MSHR50489EDL]|uniref:DUF3592 domain-containing protein n=1 Tax=Oligella sp. MSHR50489EDL TaxID=3139409 RepID=UPI003D8154F3
MRFLQAFYDAQPAFWFMVGFIVLVNYLSYRDQRFVNKAVLLEGEVSGYETVDSESSVLYRAKIHYVFNGQNYYKSSTVSSSVKLYEVGQRLPLLVDPDNANSIRVLGRISESPLRLFLKIMKICMWFGVFIFFAWYLSSLIRYI